MEKNFRKLCECAVSFERYCEVDQHRKTKAHSSKLSDVRQAAAQRLLNEVSEPSDSEADAVPLFVGPNKRERQQFYRDTCAY